MATALASCADPGEVRIANDSWSPCGRYECASVDVPFDWQNRTTAAKQVAAKRLLAVDGATRQLWLVPGGPGFAGTVALARLMDELHLALPGVDIYTLDPHGVGASGHLRCQAAEYFDSVGGAAIVSQEVPACLGELASRFAGGLWPFGLTASAHDLAAFIHATREPTKRIIVLASSAATVWAQRLLLLYPDLVDGVILDAFVPPDFSAKSIDATAEAAFGSLLRACSRDPFCAQQFPDAAARTRSLWRALEAGHCGTLEVPSAELQYQLFRMLGSYPWNTMVPALLRRIERCEWEDVAFVQAVLGLEQADGARDASAERSFSEVLFQLITASEFWDHPTWTSEDQYRAHLRDLTRDSLLGTGAHGLATSETMLQWPRYREPLDGLWPDVDIPMLIMHGELDPRISPAAAGKAHRRYAGDRQRYISFPSATHNVIGGTPTAAGDCAASLLIQFVEDPEGPLDLRCVDEIARLDFSGAMWGDALIGTPDYWSGARASDGMRELGATPAPITGAWPMDEAEHGM